MYKRITFKSMNGISYWNPVLERWEKGKIALTEKVANYWLPILKEKFGNKEVQLIDFEL